MSGVGSSPSLTAQKRRLDTLLTFHACSAAAIGGLAIIFPHMFGIFFGEEAHGSLVRWNPDDGQTKITHVVIRIYGALICGQSIIVWHVRKCSDGELRRALVFAYFVVFSLTSLVLVRSQFTDDHWHTVNWVNISFFVALALFYGWFCFFNPPPTFEGLDNMVK
eukprot:TRINITY_DN7643_c0_g1_i1.p1 TRINITY_DN7643_c0_g1~~TRINITY_DN7643_c0_g1_i1.p1  ORF type:complete len:184 (+),score=30.53 TRINITY_DN7643_c0_g1_i1:63-554(+)